MNRLRVLLGILILFIAGGVSASEMFDGETCHVEPDEVIQGDLFVFCGELLIEGRVEGSILGAARTATLTGTVVDSIYLLGGEFIMRGELGKDLHFGGIVVTIQEEATFTNERGGLITANLSNTVDDGATVPGNVINLGYQLIVDGTIDGQINFWGSALQISGQIGDDVTASVGNAESDGSSSQIQTLLIPFPFEVDLVDPGLVLFPTGYIDGQLEYTGPTPGSFNNNQLATDPIYNQTGVTIFDPNEPTSSENIERYLERVLREFATLGFVGLVFMIIIPRQMQSPLRYIRSRPVSTLSVGMLSFILSFPIVLIMALLSIFIIFILSLLPIDTVVIFGGVVLGLANIGVASIFYFTAIYVARVVVALAVGRVLLRIINIRDNGMRGLFFSLLIGTFLVSLMTTIPIPAISWGVNAFMAFLGLGAILTLLRAKISAFIASTPEPTLVSPQTMAYATSNDAPSPSFLPYLNEDPPDYAGPIIEQDNSPGMDNLPEGFDWWGRSDKD